MMVLFDKRNPASTTRVSQYFAEWYRKPDKPQVRILVGDRTLSAKEAVLQGQGSDRILKKLFLITLLPILRCGMHNGDMLDAGIG